MKLLLYDHCRMRPYQRFWRPAYSYQLFNKFKQADEDMSNQTKLRLNSFSTTTKHGEYDLSLYTENDRNTTRLIFRAKIQTFSKFIER